jgi:hypothetical protein
MFDSQQELHVIGSLAEKQHRGALRVQFLSDAINLRSILTVAKQLARKDVHLLIGYRVPNQDPLPVTFGPYFIESHRFVHVRLPSILGGLIVLIQPFSDTSAPSVSHVEIP